MNLDPDLIPSYDWKIVKSAISPSLPRSKLDIVSDQEDPQEHIDQSLLKGIILRGAALRRAPYTSP